MARTALLLENPAFIEKARARIEHLLATQDANDYLGIYAPLPVRLIPLGGSFLRKVTFEPPSTRTTASNSKARQTGFTYSTPSPAKPAEKKPVFAW